MSFFLSPKASRARLREAENARKNRAEFVQALSQRQVTRREPVKWGLLTAGGLWAPMHGLSPFARSAYADNIPTGAPPSPLFGVKEFSQPMPRFDVLPRKAVSTLNPAPTEQANTTRQMLNPVLVHSYPKTGDPAKDNFGPIEGGPPGPIWAHQAFNEFFPQVAVEVTQEGAKTNTTYNPMVPSNLNSGINPATPIPLRFHPGFPVQKPEKVWTFNGTIPPKLLIGRYGEPILFRHRNKLPFNIKENGGFGIHTISTHEHNGHHGAENDGFTGVYFYPRPVL
jgi:hypothetical protein